MALVQTPAGESDRSRHELDLPTVVAIGIAAALVQNLAHELIGHGGATLLVGGDPIAVSSAYWDYDRLTVTRWGARLISAGGTLANLAIGGLLLLFWGRVRRVTSRHPRLGYFLWTCLALNLFSGAGYMMVDPLFGFGDWGGFVDGLEPQLPLRLGISAVGVSISLYTVFFSVRALEPFLGSSARRRRALQLCWAPYLAAGILFPVSTLLLPEEGPFLMTTALAHLGGAAWLAWWVPFQVPAIATHAHAPLGITRSRGWLVLGASATAFIVLVLGRSIPFGP